MVLIRVGLISGVALGFELVAEDDSYSSALIDIFIIRMEIIWGITDDEEDEKG